LVQKLALSTRKKSGDFSKLLKLKEKGNLGKIVHNPKDGGSTPSPATKKIKEIA